MLDSNNPLSGIQATISIMIAASDPVLISNLQSFFESQRQIQVVSVVSRSQDCLERLAIWEPDVLLYEENLTETNAYDICRSIKEKQPLTAVFVMTDERDYENPNYHRRLMSVNGSGVFAITETPNFLDWIPAMQNAVELLKTAPARNQANMGRVIAVHSLKGGVGRTLISANLSTALAQPKEKEGFKKPSVLVVDLNWPFGGLETYLNLTPSRSILDLLPVMDSLTNQRIHDATIGNTTELRVLSAPLIEEQTDFLRDLLEEDLLHNEFEATDDLLRDITNASLAIGPDPEDERRRIVMEYTLRKAKAKQALLILTRRLLLSAPRYYDFIVFDLPPGLDELTLTVLRSTDVNLLVCTPDVPSVRTLRYELDTLPQFNILDERCKLVLNRVHKTNVIKPIEIKQWFDKWQWVNDLPEDSKLEELVNTSVTAVGVAQEPAFAVAIRKIAQQLIKEMENQRRGELLREYNA